MKISKCDLCGINILDEKGISFSKYDLCDSCVFLVRIATCIDCKGEGKIRKRIESSNATCGESRPEYITVKCRCRK